MLLGFFFLKAICHLIGIFLNPKPSILLYLISPHHQHIIWPCAQNRMCWALSSSGLICVIWIPLIPRPQSGEMEGRGEGRVTQGTQTTSGRYQAGELGHSEHTERTDENSWLKTIYIFTWPQQCDPLAGQYKSREWNPGTGDQETCSWQRYPILTSIYNVHQSIFRVFLFDHHK